MLCFGIKGFFFHLWLSNALPGIMNHWLIDWLVFNAVFNSISVISRRPMNLPMLSWSSFNLFFSYIAVAGAHIHAFLKFLQPALRTILFPIHWLLFHITIVETMDSDQRGMNPVPMTTINPRKEYWPSRWSNQRPPVMHCAPLNQSMTM